MNICTANKLYGQNCGNCLYHQKDIEYYKTKGITNYQCVAIPFNHYVKWEVKNVSGK